MSYWDKFLRNRRRASAVMHKGQLYKRAPNGAYLPFSIGGADETGLTKTLNDIKAAFEKNRDEVKELVDKQAEEIKTLGETTAETAKALKEASDRDTEISTELKELGEELKKNQDRGDELEAKLQRLGLTGPGGEENKSVGAMFVESEAYKDYSAVSFNGQSGRIQVKTLITGASIGNVPGYFYDPVRVANIFAQPDRIERVRSLFSINRTTAGAIEYVRETGFTNAAAAVAEGDEKPESSLEFEIIAQSMKTIAHWLPATRQIIADAPALEDYINNRLLIGLKLVEDHELLYGDGTGANIEGIFEVPGIQEYAISDDTDNNGDPQTKLDAIRRAILKARVAEYPASGVVLNPNDWADIELLKGDDAHYIWINVNDGGAQRVWRANVVDTTAVEPGIGLTGAFELGAAIWDREDAEIRVTDSHAGYFTRNIWTILAEERLALAVYRPEAFVKIDFEEGS